MSYPLKHILSQHTAKVQKVLLCFTLLANFNRIAFAQIHPDVSCTINGTTTVTEGQTVTYTLSGCSASSWTATCGSIQSSSSTSCTVYFNQNGCSSSVITAKNGTGTTLATTTVTVNQPPTLTGGTINAPVTQTINYNYTPAGLTATAAGGGYCPGGYTYQWYSSPNNSTFNQIAGATGQNYSPGPLTATTYYKRSVTCGSQFVYTTNTATVTVYPQIVPGTIAPSSQTTNFMYNATPLNLTGVSGGNSVYTYQWQITDVDDIHWSNIAGATSTSYSPGPFDDTAPDSFRVMVISNADTAYSSIATIVSLPQIQGTVTPALSLPYYNSAPGKLTLGSVSGGNNSYTYQWQSSPDSVTWTNISGQTGTTYNPGNDTALIYYHVVITSNGDPVASTAATVKPDLIAGAITPDALTIASGTSPGQLDADPASGGAHQGSYLYQWEVSSNGVNFTPISGATSLDYSPGTLSSNFWYRRRVTCTPDTAVTNVCQITISSGSSDLTFVRTRTILKAGVMDTVTADGLTSPYDVAQTTTYYDGTGRAIQTVAKQASPLQNDMVSSVVYDNFGRQAEQYMPYTATTNDGNYKSTAIEDGINFNTAQFPGEQYYYAQTNYEASPLNRVVQSYASGSSWVGNNVGQSQQYLFNTVADSVQLWNISSVQLSLPVNGGVYQSGQLFKTVLTNEAGHLVVEYKDKLGKVILRKVQQGTSPSSGHFGWACSYYVYDTLQNLRVIIQPRAVTIINGTWTINQTIANELCFRYEYDGRRRLAIKKVPGAGQTWMVYDARDRVAMTQDSLLRSLHKWTFLKYDLENRPDSLGLITDASNYNNLAYHDSLAYYSTSYPNVTGYTNEILGQTFYDDYSWVSTYGAPVSSTMATNYTSNSNYFVTGYNTSPTYSVAQTASPIARGMATGTLKKVIGTTSQYLYSVNFYDDRGRAIQSQSTNFTGAVDTATVQYDFSGAVLRTLLDHRKSGNTIQNHTVSTKMDYDQSFRLRHIWKNIDNAGSDQLIDSLQYNELGQLTGKYLGASVDSLIYTYNVRGWLNSINKNYIAGTANHYFGMELGYDKTTSAAPGNTYLNPQVDGHIEGIVWKGAGSGINRKYDFSYYASGWLQSAAFLQNTTGSGWDKNMVDYSATVSGYDANGNITSMTQRGFTVGGSAAVDSLTYSYLGSDSSNKLMGVVDAANNPTSLLGDFHYNPATKQGTDYNYDGNGNLTHDNNKNIVP